MNIKCQCATCQAEFEVAQEFVGRKTTCPLCSSSLLLATDEPRSLESPVGSTIKDQESKYLTIADPEAIGDDFVNAGQQPA